MATKITSDCHGRQDFTITDTCPSDCDMWGSFHLLLFHKHDILSCLFVNVCQWLWLKAWGRKAQRSCCVVCAKWRLDVLGTIHVFAHPTPLVLSVSVLDWKGSYIFLCVFGCVFPRFFLTNELHTEHYTSTVWIVMFCVSCHQNQVILLKLLQDWRNLLVAWVMRSTLVAHFGQSTLWLSCGSEPSWPMWLCVVLNPNVYSKLEQNVLDTRAWHTWHPTWIVCAITGRGSIWENVGSHGSKATNRQIRGRND